jgi:hypothetical protein
MSIGTLSARILADASGIKSGMGLTRSELKATREAFMATRTDAEKMQAALDVLAKANAKGAFKEAKDYEAAVKETRRQLDPAVKAQEAARAEAERTASERQRADEREAAAVISRNRTEREKYSDAVRRLAELKAGGQFKGNEDAYRREIERLKETLPAIRAKRDAEQNAIRETRRLFDDYAARRRAELERPAVNPLGHLGGATVPTAGTNNLRMLAGGAAGAAAAAVGGMAAGIWSGAGEQLAEIREAAKSATKLGVDPKTYLRLAEAAREFRVETGAVENAVFRAQTKIGEAMAGMEEPRKAFDALGLSWDKLSKATPVEAFTAINEAIQRQGTVADRAAAAQKLYGESVRELGPLLQLTRDQFDALTKAQEAKGLILLPSELEKIKAAGDAVKDNEQAWRGLTRSVAPFRAEVDTAWSGTKASIWGGLQSWVQEFRDAHKTLADYAAESAATAGPVDATAAARTQVAALEAQKKAREEAAQKAKEFREEVGRLDQGLAIEAATLGMTGRQAEIYRLRLRGLSDDMANLFLRHARWNEAAKLTADLTKQLSRDATIANWRMSADQAKLYELALQGVNREQLESIRILQVLRAQQQAFAQTQDKATESWFKTWEAVRQQQLQAAGGRDPKDQAASETAELRRQLELQKLIAQMKREGASGDEINARVRLAEMSNEFERQAEALGRRNKVFEAGRQIAESVKTPQEKYRDEIRKIEEAEAAGAFVKNEYSRATKRAADEFARAANQSRQARGVEGVRAGTAAAEDRIDELRRAERAQDAAARIAADVRRQVRAPEIAAAERRQEAGLVEQRKAGMAEFAERERLTRGDLDEDPTSPANRLLRERSPAARQTQAAAQFGRPGTQTAPGEDRTAKYWQQQLQLQTKILGALQRIAGGEAISLVETK